MSVARIRCNSSSLGRRAAAQLAPASALPSSQIRPLWRHYFQNTQALVLVVDSNDRCRIDQARDEIHRMLVEEELRGVPLLIYANKQDLPNAMSAAEVTEKLGLSKLRQRKWYIQESCAPTGEGLYDGLDWLRAACAGEL